MDKTDTGGPAFPKLDSGKIGPRVNRRGKYPQFQKLSLQSIEGMTLLDWFAGLAMQAMVHAFMKRPDDGSDIDTAFEGIAIASYKQAEAMITEKRKREDG